MKHARPAVLAKIATVYSGGLKQRHEVKGKRKGTLQLNGGKIGRKIRSNAEEGYSKVKTESGENRGGLLNIRASPCLSTSDKRPSKQ